MQLARAFVEVGLVSPEAEKSALRAIEAQRGAEGRPDREAKVAALVGPEAQEIAALVEAVALAKAALKEAVHRHNYVKRSYGSYHEYCEWWEHPACGGLEEGDTFPPGTSVSLD